MPRRLSAATACVIALIALAPALHVQADTLVLRLDADLGPARSLAEFTDAPAVLLGVSDLRGRLRKVRDRVADMERQRARHRTEIETQERLIAGLESVLSAQDGAIASLQTELARPAATPAPAPEPPAAPVAPPPMQMLAPGGFNTDRLLIDGGLIGVIAVLLGWSLYLRSRVRAAQAASAMPLEEVEGLDPVEDVTEPGPGIGAPPPEVGEWGGVRSAEPQVVEAASRAVAPRSSTLDEGPSGAPEPADPVTQSELPQRTPADPVDQAELPTLPAAPVASPESPESARGPGAESAGAALDFSGSEDPTTQPSLTDLETVRAALASTAPVDADPASEPDESPAAATPDDPFDLSTMVIQPPGGERAAPDPAPGIEAAPIEWTETMIRRTAADPDALREADTLIAFEDYEPAKRLLDELIKSNPDNPEYRLRLIHVQAELGNQEDSEKEEALLAAVMDGPLSETLLRVKQIGRDLLPGHRLFDESFTRKGPAPTPPDTKEEASILKEIFSGPEGGREPGDDRAPRDEPDGDRS